MLKLSKALYTTEQLQYFKQIPNPCGTSVTIDPCAVPASLQSGSDDCSTTSFNAVNETYVKCREFVFDKSMYKSTIVTDWNLVCDRKHIKTLSTSSYYVGFGVGGLFGGTLASTYGRKVTFVASIYICFILSLVCVWYPQNIVEYSQL